MNNNIHIGNSYVFFCNMPIQMLYHFFIVFLLLICANFLHLLHTRTLADIGIEVIVSYCQVLFIFLTVFDEHTCKLLCLLLVNFFLLLSLIIFWVRHFIHPKIKKIFTCGLLSFLVSCLFLLYIWSNFCIGRA